MSDTEDHDARGLPTIQWYLNRFRMDNLIDLCFYVESLLYTPSDYPISQYHDRHKFRVFTGTSWFRAFPDDLKGYMFSKIFRLRQFPHTAHVTGLVIDHFNKEDNLIQRRTNK